MLRFHLIGDWPAGSITCTPTASTFDPTAEVQQLIDIAWAARKRELGDHLYDGRLCRLESFHHAGSHLTLLLSETSYKSFLGTNYANPALADRFGPAALANALGFSTAVLSSDDHIMLAVRSRTSAYHAGRIHTFGGTIEPGHSINVFDEALRELSEEAGLNRSDIADIRCAALAEDASTRQPELVFLARSTLPRTQIEQQINKQEHSAFWPLPVTRESLESAVHHKPRLTPIAAAALLLWGRRLYGLPWFTEHSCRMTA